MHDVLIAARLFTLRDRRKIAVPTEFKVLDLVLCLKGKAR